MQEENHGNNNELENNQTSEVAETEQKNSIEHVYFEVGNDLTSKPNALADLIQTVEYPHVEVFCNSPSEADFVDAILRKRNIPCGKLIGHVPYSKISQTLHQLNTGSLNVIIVTDISANEIDPGQFDISINYAIHEDPEIYLHRCTPHSQESKLQKVYSLVGPLDFGNFHYLKKVVDFEFSKGALPTKDDVAKSEAERLFTRAVQSPHGKDAATQDLVALIQAHKDCNAIIGYLLHNTMVTLPELSNRSSSKQDDSVDNSRRDRRGDRGDRYDRRRGGDRYSSRDKGRYDDSFSDDRRDNRQMREEYEPPKRDVRFYLGQGLNDGLTDYEFRNVLENELNLTPEQIKRLSIRDNYAFIDFDEESSEEIIQKLQELELPNIGKLFIRKATVINSPRIRISASSEDNDDNNFEEESANDTFNDEDSDNGDWCDASDETTDFAEADEED
ncbi:MAG: helicase-related protein [Bdellovibrionota bacterium]|jgi:superfamily II DNA/RNA helicase